jgi:transposase
MAGKTIETPMLKQILRLHIQGVPLLRISTAVGASRNTVKRYLRQIEALQISTETLLDMDDEQISALLQKKPSVENPRTEDLEALFPYFEKELVRVGMNRMVLWGEYKRRFPDGYNYSRFCDHFRQWRQSRKGTMHFEHDPGKEMYMDFAGKPLFIVDRATGALEPVEVYIATLGYSHYTYVEAIDCQKKEPFLDAVANTKEFFGGVARIWIPDNMKSAVTKADNYEALVNNDFLDMANHYGATVLPTRSRKPRDKAIVEKSVNLVYSRIYAALRDEAFHSLAELNRAIRNLLTDYNEHPFQIRPGSRQIDFEQVEKPLLLPLPTERFELKTYREVTVQKIGHVCLHEDKHYYSVPYRYIGRKVKLVYSSRHVWVYCDSERIAYHPRISRIYGYTTLKDHLSSTHRFVSEWTPEKFISWGRSIAPVLGEYVALVFETVNYPEQAYKSCLGILSLEKKVGRERLVKAVERATHFGAYGYTTIRNILRSGLENVAYGDGTDAGKMLPGHDNIRGPKDYQ